MHKIFYAVERLVDITFFHFFCKSNEKALMKPDQEIFSSDEGESRERVTEEMAEQSFLDLKPKFRKIREKLLLCNKWQIRFLMVGMKKMKLVKMVKKLSVIKMI